MEHNDITEEIAIKSERSKKVRIILSIFTFCLAAAIYIYLFVPYNLSIDDMGGIEVVEENGIISFYAFIYGGKIEGAPRFEETIYDTPNSVAYFSEYITYFTTRWNMWFYKQRKLLTYDQYTTDGQRIHSSGVTGHPDENGEHHIYRHKCGRLYYLNPDGSFVLLWECDAVK